MSVNKPCENGDYGCGGYYTCWPCKRKRMAQAYRQLTPEQKAYDRHVDPRGAYHEDFSSSCSCHISAPCSYCENSWKEETQS